MIIYRDRYWLCDEFVIEQLLYGGRGGYSIFGRRGTNLGGGFTAPTFKFARFSQKLHEIKKILVRGGGRAMGAPPLDPPLVGCRIGTAVCI